MKNEIEIPKLTCIGCQKRDEIIRRLAEEIDKLQSQNKKLTLENELKEEVIK